MSDTWDQMHTWYLVLPPSRPSATQLNRLRSQVSEVSRDVPVAVLGSTPEFRDLLWECGFKYVYILERNLMFFRSMSDARIYRNPEVLISGDWLDTLPQHKEQFGLILSDLTSGNLHYDVRPYFYQSITNALRPGGLFCDKVLTHPGPHIPVGQLVEKYAELPMNLLHINNFSSEMLFCSELLSLKDEVDSSLFYDILEAQVANQRVRAFAKSAQWITPRNCVWYYGRKWHELEPDYCPSMVRVASDDDEDPASPYFGRLKYFVHRKG